MNLSFLLTWLLFNDFILSIDTIAVFNFNSTHHPPSVDGVSKATCNDTSGCDFNCRGHDSCPETEFHCADNAPCNLFCMFQFDGKGQPPCGNSNVYCPAKANCEISATGPSAMYSTFIYAQSSASVMITAQGANSLDNLRLHCPEQNSVPENPNCMVRLIGQQVVKPIFVLPKFWIHNLSNFQFECTGVDETDYYKLFGNSDETPMTIFYQKVEYHMKYESGGLNCTNDASFILPNRKCIPFTNSTLSPSNAPTSAPTDMPSSAPNQLRPVPNDEDDDKSIATWKLTLILIAVVVAFVSIAAFFGYKCYQSRDAQNNDESSQYEQANLFEESDGDDSLMMVVKKSLNEQQMKIIAKDDGLSGTEIWKQLSMEEVACLIKQINDDSDVEMSQSAMARMIRKKYDLNLSNLRIKRDERFIYGIEKLNGM